MQKGTPLDMELALFCVRNDADPYDSYLYIRVLLEALFFSFNAQAHHLALLDAKPMDYSHGMVLVWEEPPYLVPLSPDVLLRGLHSEEGYKAFLEDLKTGVPIIGLVDRMAGFVRRTKFFKDLSDLARGEPDEKKFDAFFQEYRR